MITYLYWTVLVAITAIVFLGLGVRFKLWQAGFFLALLVAVVGTLTYFFYFEQIFVKRFGGVMPISAQEGTYHLGVTWKGDNLWVESWDPKENVCHFREYSRSNMLEGEVKISDCNPLRVQGTVQQVLTPSKPAP